MTEIGSLSRIEHYFATLSNLLAATSVSDSNARPIALAAAINWMVDRITRVKSDDNKIIFVGNGGSAGISSHLAIDYLKNGGVAALAFNDGASLTCLANDLGYENVFSKQIDMHGRKNDLLIAISSSGRSQSILNAVASAQHRGLEIVTLSGFRPDNPLRALGSLNFHVNSDQYGFVEISHLALCHAFLDLKMGWH